MCLTSLMQPVFYAIQHPSQYINTMLWEISYLWLVTMPFLIEYKSHFSWQLMPTVWGMQWKPLSHTHITAMMLQWFNDDNWYYSSKAVCGYRSHCIDCYKDNSKQIPAVQKWQTWALQNKGSLCIRRMIVNFNYFNTFTVFFFISSVLCWLPKTGEINHKNLTQ